MNPIVVKKFSLAGAAALVLAGGIGLASAATSPVGDWDFVLSSARERGVAQITFNVDGTLVGSQITAGTGSSTSALDPRTGLPVGTGSERVPSAGGSGNSNTVTKVYGGATISGTWTTNRAGRVIGLLDESTLLISATSSNQPVTNAVSFVGTVSGGRMSLVGTDLNGRTTYRGVTAAVVPSVAGNYYATVRNKGLDHLEFYTLTPNGSTPNLYDLTGVGPAGAASVGTVPLTGSVLISKQSQVCVLISQTDTNGSAITLNVLNGTGNYNRGTWRLTGTDLSNGRSSYKVEKQ